MLVATALGACGDDQAIEEGLVGSWSATWRGDDPSFAWGSDPNGSTMILEVTAKGVLHLFGESSGQRVKVAAEVESGRVYLTFSCFGKPLFGSCDHLPSSLGCAIDDRERNLTCDEGVFVLGSMPGQFDFHKR